MYNTVLVLGVQHTGEGGLSRWLSGKRIHLQCRKPSPDPWVRRSPGGEDGNPFSIHAWIIPWTKEPGGLQSMGSQSCSLPEVSFYIGPVSCKLTKLTF